MSAPVKERPRAAAGGTAVLDAPARPARTTIPAQRGARPSSEATGRAYARRDERLRKLGGSPAAGRTRPDGAGRTQFVLLVMVLLVAGLVATLWLSTAAAADSYQLQNARAVAQRLTEQSEQLHQEVAEAESAPALAKRATELGMQPVTDAARLVVAQDGTVTVVGTPKAVAAPVAAATAPTGPPAAVTTADGQAAAGDAAAAAAAAAAGAGPTVAGATVAGATVAGATVAGPAAAGRAGTGQAGVAAAVPGARTAAPGTAAGGAGPAAAGTRAAGTGAAAGGGAPSGPAPGAAGTVRSGQQPAAGTHR